MKVKNIFIAVFISLMAVLIATPLMAQVDYSTIMDPEFEEYHELAQGNPVVRVDFTLLMRAAKAGQLWKVKLLLHLGADVNAKTDAGMTALMYASYYGHADVVNRLLDEENIDVNATNNGDYTALMFAAMNGHEDVVNLLINKGKADKTMKSKKGFTAYDYAECSYIEAMAIILSASHGGDISDSEVEAATEQAKELSRILNETQVFIIKNIEDERIKELQRQHNEMMIKGK